MLGAPHEKGRKQPKTHYLLSVYPDLFRMSAKSYYAAFSICGARSYQTWVVHPSRIPAIFRRPTQIKVGPSTLPRSASLLLIQPTVKCLKGLRWQLLKNNPISSRNITRIRS